MSWMSPMYRIGDHIKISKIYANVFITKLVTFRTMCKCQLYIQVSFTENSYNQKPKMIVTIFKEAIKYLGLSLDVPLILC